MAALKSMGFHLRSTDGCSGCGACCTGRGGATGVGGTTSMGCSTGCAGAIVSAAGCSIARPRFLLRPCVVFGCCLACLGAGCAAGAGMSGSGGSSMVVWSSVCRGASSGRGVSASLCCWASSLRMISLSARISCTLATSKPMVATPSTTVHTSIMMRMVSLNTLLPSSSHAHTPKRQHSAVTVSTVAVIFRLSSRLAIS